MNLGLEQLGLIVTGSEEEFDGEFDELLFAEEQVDAAMRLEDAQEQASSVLKLISAALSTTPSCEFINTLKQDATFVETFGTDESEWKERIDLALASPATEGMVLQDWLTWAGPFIGAYLSMLTVMRKRIARKMQLFDTREFTKEEIDSRKSIYLPTYKETTAGLDAIAELQREIKSGLQNIEHLDMAKIQATAKKLGVVYTGTNWKVVAGNALGGLILGGILPIVGAVIGAHVMTENHAKKGWDLAKLKSAGADALKVIDMAIALKNDVKTAKKAAATPETKANVAFLKKSLKLYKDAIRVIGRGLAAS